MACIQLQANQTLPHNANAQYCHQSAAGSSIGGGANGSRSSASPLTSSPTADETPTPAVSYVEATRTLPFVDDSAAATPLSENEQGGAGVFSFPSTTPSMSNVTTAIEHSTTLRLELNNFSTTTNATEEDGSIAVANTIGQASMSSRRSSYNSNMSRLSDRLTYDSHGDIYGRLGYSIDNANNTMLNNRTSNEQEKQQINVKKIVLFILVPSI